MSYGKKTAMELGSEYHLDVSKLRRAKDNLFSYLNAYPNVLYMESGRSALRWIAGHLKKEGEILLPEYLCESVIRCFDKRQFSFYQIHPDFMIDMEDLREKVNDRTAGIFLMHYFGTVQPEGILRELRQLAEARGITIIEDATHSLFSTARTIGDFVAASVRKWMPIPQGGFCVSIGGDEVYNREEILQSTDNERTEGMLLKKMFLQGELDCNPEYRRIFRECEERLDRGDGIYRISDFAEFLISCTDISEIRERRRGNYQMLSERLTEQGFGLAVEYEEAECPFACVLRIPERDQFREYLIERKIYCAIHWPFDGILPEQRPGAIRNASELISLPIDQRYGAEYMEHLARVAAEYGGKRSF